MTSTLDVPPSAAPGPVKAGVVSQAGAGLHLVEVGDRVDRLAAQQAVRDLLSALGQDVDAEHLKDTPRRVAAAFAEMLHAPDVGIPVLRRLLAAGHTVTATWLQKGEPDRVLAELGYHARLTLTRLDVTHQACIDGALADPPELAAVVNLVGGYDAGTKVHQTAPEAFEAMFRVNLTPSFLLARATIPRLIARGGGAFIAISSRAALQPFAGAAGYIASKAALVALIQALDVEYRDDGVRCNVILPSTIDTPANRKAQPDADLARWVPPEQIADVIAFLLSTRSLAISGATIPVYGRA